MNEREKQRALSFGEFADRANEALMKAREKARTPELVEWERRVGVLLSGDPTAHPDFYGCEEPSENHKHEHPIVYVPNLVHALHRLGGPANCEVDGDSVGAHYLKDDSGEKVCTIDGGGSKPDGSSSVMVYDWHWAMKELSVVFELPAKWHLGEWSVAYVMSIDMFSGTTELERDVALLCDQMIGQRLADQAKL